MNSKYILYVVPGEHNSDIAMSYVQWQYSSPFSVDGDIRRCNPQRLPSCPTWLNGVPILFNTTTKALFKGSRCVEQLIKIQKCVQERRDGIADFPPPNDPTKFTTVDIGPDPRDNFQRESTTNIPTIPETSGTPITHTIHPPQPTAPPATSAIPTTPSPPQYPIGHTDDNLPVVMVPQEALTFLQEPPSIATTPIPVTQSPTSHTSQSPHGPPSTMIIGNPRPNPVPSPIPNPIPSPIPSSDA